MVTVHDAGAPEVVLALVPVLFIYVPVWLCNWRGVDSYAYQLALPRFSDRAEWGEALRINALLIGVVVGPWLAAYHYWQTLGFGLHNKWVWPRNSSAAAWLDELFGGALPEQQLAVALGIGALCVYHLFFVAVPEEFFYRGYMQTRLAEVLPNRWRVLGATIGPALFVTSLYFAFGHSLVRFQWWHFSIFIPSLAFGWLRERTGGVLAGALFHAWCNVTVTLLDTLYGIVPPEVG